MTALLRFLLLGILTVNALPSNNQQKDPALPAARRQLGENGGRLSLPLTKRRNKALLNEEEFGEWAQRQAQALKAKYNVDGLHERATGTARLINHNMDATYYASIGLGTPPVAYNVILDTGSSDLWVAGKSCSIGCINVKKFDSNSSSTFQSIPTSFEIRYGSATATGTLGRDVVQMAGYEVRNQRFAVVDAVYSSYSTLLSSPVSGLMGLAFQDIAASGGNPFWLNLVNAGVWDKPMMGFCLTDLVGTNATFDEQGGVFTMGGIDESLFTGEIDYVPLPISPDTYWELPVISMAINGNHLNLPTGSGSYAAIDTGTTLIGAPSAVIDQMIAHTSGAFQGSGQYTDYFLYPCNETMTTTISFGSRTWEISTEDFKLQRLSNGTCLSSFFRMTMSSSAPSWIIGDTFLKNVYSVFRYDPPSIGFANLSATALALNTVGATLPTPTLGASIVVTATVVNGGDFSITTPSYIFLLVSCMALVFMTSHY